MKLSHRRFYIPFKKNDLVYVKKRCKQKTPAGVATWSGTDSRRSTLFVGVSTVSSNKMLKYSMSMPFIHISRKIQLVKIK